MKISVFVLLCALAAVTNGYKILVLAPFNGKSHWLFMEKIVKSLLQRGHEVTAITSFKTAEPIANYTEVLIDPPMDMEKFFPQERLLKLSDPSPFLSAPMLPWFASQCSGYSLETANIQKFIHRKDLHYDLVINEEFFQDAFLMFAHKFKAPLITISTYGYSDFFDRQFGLLTPWSHVPHLALSFTDDMTFMQRWYNTALSTFDWIIRQLMYLPGQNALAEKHFAHLEPLPSIQELQKNVSLILINTHRSMLIPRPSMPGIVHIGGAHIKKPNPLPSHIQQFLDESPNGVIYFSFGTVVKASKLPKEKINAFLDTFRQLKQRVLWKFEDESIENVPPNVMIRKWLPQSDILAHPNVVLFISHGGMFGNMESTARGVPLLIVPFFGDQHRNAIRTYNAGYGRYLKFADVTKDALLEIVQEMVSNKSYLNKAKEVSAIYRDNLVDPMEEAMFWIEYVCRHRGAKHLKSNAIYMNWFSYLLLDVLVASIFVLVLFVFLIYFAITRLCCRRKSSQSKKVKKN